MRGDSCKAKGQRLPSSPPHSPGQLWGASRVPWSAGHPAPTAGQRCRQVGTQIRQRQRRRQKLRGRQTSSVMATTTISLCNCIRSKLFCLHCGPCPCCMPEHVLVPLCYCWSCHAHLMGLLAGYCTSCVCIASYSSFSVLPCTRAAAVGKAGKHAHVSPRGLAILGRLPPQHSCTYQPAAVAPQSQELCPIRDQQGSTGMLCCACAVLCLCCAGLP